MKALPWRLSSSSTPLLLLLQLRPFPLVSSQEIGHYQPSCANFHEPCPAGVFVTRCKENPCGNPTKTCQGKDQKCHPVYCGGCHAVCCSESGGGLRNQAPSAAQAPPPLPAFCKTKDIRRCSDGTVLFRLPELYCEFPSCEEDEEDSSTQPFRVEETEVIEAGDFMLDDDEEAQVAEEWMREEDKGGPGYDEQANVCLTKDIRRCPDGTPLFRDPDLRCEFPACPEDTMTPPEQTRLTEGENTARPCTKDLRGCPNGQGVGRDPDNNCRFFPCKGQESTRTQEKEKDTTGVGKACPLDLRYCPNGQGVSRDPFNNCAFFPCEGEESAAQPQVEEQVEEDTEPVGKPCTLELRKCPNGEAVGRDPNNNCEFFPCEREESPKCDDTTWICDDLSTVSRNPDRCCVYDPCPDEGILARIERMVQEMACEAASLSFSGVKPEK